MKNIFLIACNTVKEIRRNKLLYALLLTAGVIMVGGLILGPLSLSEQTRLSVNFAFTACHIGLVAVAMYFASALLFREREKKTLLALFSKPVRRTQFVLGKFLGLSFILCAVLIFLLSFVCLIHIIHGQAITAILFTALWGIFLEALVLSAVAFCFSCFASSAFLVLVYSVLIFVIGHSASGIFFFLNRNEGLGVFKLVVSVAVRILPDLEKLNWRSYALYQTALEREELIFTSLYGFSWIIFLLIVTAFLFERKQIV